jgi:hypothetical protein
MTELVWDEVGTRTFETGVDHGVLYLPNGQGVYNDGVAWNGLVSVSESPSGAEANAQYADNIKYLNLISAEEFGATIEAFTYPDEFAQFDGLATPSAGVMIGQQARKSFGLCYRTRMGNDLEGDDYGYKLHLVYGATAAPSEKAYTTINDSPEAITFSWEISTTPVAVAGLRPTSMITIDSTKVDADTLAALETMLYGTDGVDPALPLPTTVVTMFAGGVTAVSPVQPAFNSGTHTITIPTTTGISYQVDGETVPAGALVITSDTIVTAVPNDGYVLAAGTDNDWFYDYV